MRTPEELPDFVAPAVLDAARAVGIGIAVVEIESGEPPRPRYVYVNDALSNMVGVAVADLISRPPFELLAPVDRDRVHAAFSARMRGESPSPRHECSIVAQDGSEIPIELGVHIVRGEDRVFEVLLVRDLRDRRAVEARAAASEQSYRDLVEAAPDGVVISRRGVVVYANRAGAALLGLGRSELVGRSLAEFLTPEDAERMRTRMTALVRGGPLGTSEYRARHADGRLVVVEIAAILVNFEGAPAVLAFARDVTERATVAAALARADRLTALGRLSAGMAHEINNPLAFTSLSAEALERRLAAVVPASAELDALRELVLNVRRGTDRIAAIVRDLSAFSRDSPGVPSRVELGAVLQAAIRMVAHELTPRARLEQEIEPVPRVVGDAGRLEQVFVNLLVNAAQALPDDRRGVITVRARSENTRVVVEVSDTGVGISVSALERVFDPFFTTKPAGLGTGLGLSICHGIIRSFGGDIEIESTEGRGTTVRVTLLVAAAGEETVQAAEVCPPEVRRARILIVEDALSFARMLEQVLAERHDVTLAPDTATAKRLVSDRDKSFDVVLCDMTLGDGTGVDVYEHALRERPDLAARFIFMTGGAFTPRAIEFLEKTSRPRLDKPFAISALESAIAEVMR